MTPKIAWEKVQELYNEVLEQPESQQVEYLARRCGDDLELRGCLDRMLGARQRAQAMNQTLGSSHLPPGVTSIISEPPPTQIGPYRILEQIGEGGMGTVFKAEQRTPVTRIVAVKLVKAGFDTAEVIARFASERQALARMDHANIAKVLDAGADNLGRPYFVMEYVPGLPITQFADDNRLSITQRLELFTQVCHAISHAHTKAIIHRDIKSSNVLAYLSDGKPVVKVIDFGVAKALTGDRLTDRTFNTHRGRPIGTYESMSPEQADGSPDIDTRTDVYSLGVLLYELLAGTKPFDRATFANVADQEIRRIIREVEPPRPSTRLAALGDSSTRIAMVRKAQLDALARQLRSELEWIPMKAMRKERDRRYATPLEMAGDIDNYLTGLPLLAGPESKAYRFRKFVGRNRASLAATATIIILLAGGVILSTCLFFWARRAESNYATQLTQKEKLLAEKEKLSFSNDQLIQREGILNQQQGQLSMERDEDTDALAYEARALRLNPANIAAITDSVFLLYRNPLPRHVLAHDAVVSSAAFSPNGTRLLTVSQYDARLWDVENGKLLGKMRHAAYLNSASFSPDGSRIVTTSGNTVRVWDSVTCDCLWTKSEHSSEAASAMFSPDGCTGSA